MTGLTGRQLWSLLLLGSVVGLVWAGLEPGDVALAGGLAWWPGRRTGAAPDDASDAVAPPAAAQPILPGPPAGASPEEVAQWWEGLGPAGREDWILTRPDLVGGWDGVWAADRHRVNLTLLDRAEAELRADRKRLLRRWVMAGWEGWRQWAEIKGKLIGIRDIRARLERTDPVRAYLLRFDIEGHGHAVLGFGKVDTAAHVAVYVPGMTQKLARIQVGIRDAEIMWRAAESAGESDIAFVAWWGYDMPQSWPDAASDSWARQAAPLLRAFLGGLRASRRGPAAHLSVLVQSYGTVVGGYTARTLGLPVDDLLFLGSPGTTAAHASDLNLPPEQVWAAAASRDPVPWIPRRWFGINPVDPAFGAQVFDAGTGGGFWPGRTHRSYLRADSPAMESIVLIITRQGNEVLTRPREVTGRIPGDVPVAEAAIRDAVRNPVKIPTIRRNAGEVTFRYVGTGATVVLRADGTVVAARARPADALRHIATPHRHQAVAFSLVLAFLLREAAVPDVWLVAGVLTAGLVALAVRIRAYVLSSGAGGQPSARPRGGQVRDGLSTGVPGSGIHPSGAGRSGGRTGGIRSGEVASLRVVMREPVPRGETRASRTVDAHAGVARGIAVWAVRVGAVLVIAVLALLSDPTAPAAAGRVLAGAVEPRAPPVPVDIGVVVAAVAATAGVAVIRLGHWAFRAGRDRKLRGWAEKVRAWRDIPEADDDLVVRLVAAEVFAVEPLATGADVVVPGRTLRAMWPRAPPTFRAALLRNPGAVLMLGDGIRAPADLADAELAAQVFAVGRGAIWDRAALADGWRARLPVRWQGRKGELRGILASVRETRKVVEQAGRGLVALRAEQAAPEVISEAEQRYQEAEQRMAAATDAAMTEAAAAGFRRGATLGAVEAAQQGWKRFGVAILALAVGLPPQVLSAPSGSSLDFAEHTGQSASQITETAVTGTSVTAAVGLVVAALGDRLIKKMLLINTLAVFGALAMAGLGLGGGPALYASMIIVIGVASLSAGLILGRLDVYHPAPPELKAVREARFQTSFKWSRLVVPSLIVGSIAIFGVPVTMVVLSVLSLTMSGLAWAVLRGQHPMARPRPPPAVPAELRGMVRQTVGTPHGVLRWLLSIPLLAMVTGLPATALGVAMLDQLVVLNDPTQAVAATATVVGALLVISRAASLLIGMTWPRLRQLLGRPGAITAALGRLLGRDVPGPGEFSDARLLRVITLLPTLILVPAVWLAVAPGLVPLTILVTLGESLAALARMPLAPWAEGARGRSLVNVAKTGSLAVGAAVSVAVLGGFAAAVQARVASGLDHADLVATANLRLAVVAVPVVAAGILVAHLVAMLRVGTIDELRAALQASGATADQASDITGRLVANGLRDIGSVHALYLSMGWRPVVAPRLRVAAKARRRAGVGLTAEQRRMLLDALATFELDRRAVRSQLRDVRALRAAVVTAMDTAQWARRIARLDPAAGITIEDPEPAVTTAQARLAAALDPAREAIVAAGVPGRRADRVVRGAATGRDLAGVGAGLLGAMHLDRPRPPGRPRPELGRSSDPSRSKPGGIAEGGLTPEETLLLHRALVALRRERGLTEVRWTPGGVGDRDPPLPGLRDGEELFMPRPEQVVGRLILDGVAPDAANTLVEKLWEFGWHDRDGVDVLTVFEERTSDLLRSGQWDEALHYARVFQFGGNDLAPDVRDLLEIDHAQWIVGRLDALPGTGSGVPQVKRRFRRVLAGVIREPMVRLLRRGGVAAAEVEARFGIPLAHQRILQRFADQYGYVIDVRPTNPDSVGWLQRGALPKPAHLKAKTIRPLDVWLGADAEYRGAVGFFDPVLPSPDEVPAYLWAALEERHDVRKAEYAQRRDHMAALGVLPIGPGRFELGGRADTVVFGYDAAGRRRPVTGDHDLLDIRHADGRRLTPRELLEVIIDMIGHDTGVQHPAALPWRPADPVGVAIRDDIIALHLPGREPVLRFAPGRPMTMVDVTTPVEYRVLSRSPRSAGRRAAR